MVEVVKSREGEEGEKRELNCVLAMELEGGLEEGRRTCHGTATVCAASNIGFRPYPYITLRYILSVVSCL